MPRKFVYLAGPITGLTESEAKVWRQDVAERLEDHGITGISPLRCEPAHGERYTAFNPDPLFGTAAGIAAKNMFDVQHCDLVIAYLPGYVRLSIGTILEIGWAKMANKPVILVTNPAGPLAAHPVLKACVAWTVGLLDEAVDIAVGILGGYCGGKNV